jgi:hypothetical protein
MVTGIKLLLRCLLLVLICASTSLAQVPQQTRNAALRYWQAFSELQDPPADKSTTDLLEKVSSGEAPWNKALDPIVEKNVFAIEIMQRATKLPECDWGLEYDLGPRASIAYVPKARVLARLNTLYGIRAEARGDTQEAVDAWIAGIRFAQHLTNGGSLIFSLVGAKTMIANFQALTAAARDSQHPLTANQRKQVLLVVQGLPETGFDWGRALAYEEIPLEVFVKEMRETKNPAGYFQEITARPAPKNFSVPSSTDTRQFEKLMKAAEGALREAPDKAATQLRTLQEGVSKLHLFYRESTPSFVRINDSRREVLMARQKLLTALASN